MSCSSPRAIVHTIIHVTSNRIRYRQPAFPGRASCLLGAMWVLLAFHLATA